MQLWLAVKNVLPLHTVPVQPETKVSRSSVLFANDVLLVISRAIKTVIPLLPFPLRTLFWTVTVGMRIALT